MQTPGLSRIGLALAVALGSAAAIALLVAAGRAAAGPGSLAPDLMTLPLERDQISVRRDERGRVVLRFSNEIANVAAGPLEVFPGPASANCDGDADPANDRDASQRIFTDSDGSGAYERGVDAVGAERRLGCMRYHPAHDHWHVLDIARYTLRREATRRRVVGWRKVGFCLTDARLAFPSPAGPASATYPLGSGDPSGCDASSTQGISAGWADLYPSTLAGQRLDVGRLPGGRYCLSSRADPLGLIDELDERNNVRRARLQLRPRKLRVRVLRGGCRR